MTAREAAFVSLQRYESSKKFANIEADNSIRRNRLEGPDRALYTTIFYGTIERKITLDYWLVSLSERKLADIDTNVRIILEMSLYQLHYLDRVPDYAILNDAAELCKRFAANSAVAFVNAVLRAYQRQKDKLPLPDREKNPTEWLSVRYSYPEWLCSLWQKDYGFEKTCRIFEAYEVNPPITLRVNTLKCSTEELLDRLHAKTIGSYPTEYVRDGIRLTGHCPTSEIPGFPEDCYVQDESSQLASEILDAKEGERILDACACPGGKSFTTAIRMKNHGTVISCDLHANKLKLISGEAEKLGITCITVKEQDGTSFVEEFAESFDRVLCDVPCSGLGVLSKKPDIRHKTAEDIARLPTIQYAILDNCSRYVKSGGILVYSTCTLNRAENEDNVKRFLSEHPEFRLTEIRTNGTHPIVRPSGMLTVFPDEFPGCDGFFVARMTKA